MIHKKIFITALTFLVLGINSTYAATKLYKYDSLHRLTRVERSDGTVTTYDYDDLGNRTSKIVTAPSATPVALFTASPRNGETSLFVQFTDQSTGSPTSWAWEFGDGGTSTEQNPTHTYENPGTYSVTLAVSGSSGSDSLTRTDYITVIADTTDTDNDGLPDSIENAGCTDPNDADTDDDGIIDGDEDANHNGIVDSGETDPCDVDTDGDGIQDGTEIGFTLPDVGPDTETNTFQPDLDPGTTTDPNDSDSDNDGILDGDEDTNHNGRVDAGESDPNTPDPIQQILFQDDFNDGVLDLSKWSVSCSGKNCIDGEPGEKVEEINGMLRVTADAVDKRGVAISRDIQVNPSAIITIKRRTRVHYAESPYLGSWPGPYYRDHITLKNQSTNLFGFHYLNYHYIEDSYGFGFSSDDLIDPLWDQWFEEKFVFNPLTGEATYLLNNVEQLNYIGNPLSGDIINLVFTSGGWWTGHFTEVDYIVMEQSDSGMMGDIDGNDNVNLIDAILALQISANIDPGQTINISGDVNDDGQIDIEETIYILQTVCGLR